MQKNKTNAASLQKNNTDPQAEDTTSVKNKLTETLKIAKSHYLQADIFTQASSHTKGRMQMIKLIITP